MEIKKSSRTFGQRKKEGRVFCASLFLLPEHKKTRKPSKINGFGLDKNGGWYSVSIIEMGKINHKDSLSEQLFTLLEKAKQFPVDERKQSEKRVRRMLTHWGLCKKGLKIQRYVVTAIILDKRNGRLICLR